MGAKAIGLSIAVLLGSAGSAHADDWSRIVSNYRYETAFCQKAVATAHVALALYDDSNDPDLTQHIADLREYSADLEPYCPSLQSYVDGLKPLVADLAVCKGDCVTNPQSATCQEAQSRQACDQIEPTLIDSRDRLQGFMTVVAMSNALIEGAVDDIDRIVNTKACDGGSAFSCGVLGDAYVAGKGVKRSEKDAKKYWKLAVKLYDKQCQKDHDASACWSLAMSYEQGSLGLKESKAKAKKYWAMRDKYQSP